MAIKSKKVKLLPRERKKIRIRKALASSSDRPRISVYRSVKHIYAQIISDRTGETLVSASTLDAEVTKKLAELLSQGEKAGLRNNIKSTKSVNAARALGLVLAERCNAKKIIDVVFDRNGFIYTGRIGALADGARSGGLKF